MITERVGANDDVVRASGFGKVESVRKRLPERLCHQTLVVAEADHPYKKCVLDYFNGDKTALDQIPSGQDGSGFSRNVWRAIDNIPYGQTISYKQLAVASGRPTAVRPAGTVCSLNRLILLVPCHRVIKADGGIGNYLYGTNIKEYLLRLEGAHA